MIEAALADDGPMTRAQLRDQLDAGGLRTEGQAFIHLACSRCLRGVAVRGPMVGRQHAYVLVRDWVGEPPQVDRDAALAELARRYLRGHGPASDRDLAKWAGLPLRDVRAGLAAISSEIEDAEEGAVRLRGTGAGSARMPPPRLLGAFDPSLVGWSSREEIVGDHEPRIVTGGIFRPSRWPAAAQSRSGNGRGNGSRSTSWRTSPAVRRNRSSAMPRTSPASSGSDQSLIRASVEGVLGRYGGTMSPEQTMVIETLMGIERELAEGDGSTYRERLSDDAVVVFPGKVLDKSSTVAAMDGRPPGTTSSSTAGGSASSTTMRRSSPTASPVNAATNATTRFSPAPTCARTAATGNSHSTSRPRCPDHPRPVGPQLIGWARWPRR